MKKGTPKNAIMIPTGISCGENNVLAKVSDMVTKLAPNNADKGKRFLFSVTPTYRRAWGTIKPIKEISPARLTEAPDKRETDKRKKIR